MKLKNYLKLAALPLTGLVLGFAGNFINNNVHAENKINEANNPKIILTSNTSTPYSRTNIQYRPIRWLFNPSNQAPGYRADKNNPKTLEEIAFTDKTPLERELTEWEMPSLARLIPLKKTIEKHANYYEINPMWATMFFTLESALNPTDINKLSDDYGLGQIKTPSEKLAKQKGCNPGDILYSPHLNKNKSIFDPETNIIMAMLLNRYNIERLGIKNSNQVYAIYFRGEPGVNPNGSLSDLTKNQLGAFHQRGDIYESIIPLFRLKPEELDKIQNKDTKALMKIYHQNLSMLDTYKQELNYFLSDLEQSVNNNQLAGNAREVLVYDDCLTFAKTINAITGESQKDNYERLLSVGEKLSGVTKDAELRQRVERTTGLLNEAKGK